MSKQSILISLLIILLSACTQQVPTSTPLPEEAQETQPAASTPPTRTMSELAATEAANPRPAFTITPTAAETATAVFSACPGAPGPYAAIGSQVTVVAEDIDKLKLRSEPRISPDTVIGELDRFTQLQVVGGPLCLRETGASYWFWQVKVLPDGETGWVAEGDVQHSFLVVSVGEQFFPKNTPTATTASACPGPHLQLFAGIEVLVRTENSDKLKLRSEPEIAPDTVLRELDQWAPLTVVGGPVCITSAETGISYWLWKVKVQSSGKSGWVAEGDGQNYFIESNMP